MHLFNLKGRGIQIDIILLIEQLVRLLNYTLCAILCLGEKSEIKALTLHISIVIKQSFLTIQSR